MSIDLQIDKYALDVELAEQASKFFAVAEQYVEALAERDYLKEQLTVIDSELDAAIRMRLGKECTEPKVKNSIPLEKRHKDAMFAYLEAKKKSDLLSVKKESFEQRSHMIKFMCQLYLSNYYTTDTIKAPTNAEAAYKAGRAKRYPTASTTEWSES